VIIDRGWSAADSRAVAHPNGFSRFPITPRYVQLTAIVPSISATDGSETVSVSCSPGWAGPARRVPSSSGRRGPPGSPASERCSCAGPVSCGRRAGRAG